MQRTKNNDIATLQSRQTKLLHGSSGRIVQRSHAGCVGQGRVSRYVRRMLRGHSHRLGVLYLRGEGNKSQVQDGAGHEAVPGDLRRGYQQGDSADRTWQNFDDAPALGRRAAEFRTTRDTAISTQAEGAVFETASVGQSSQSVASRARAETFRHQGLVYAVRRRNLDAGSSHTRGGQMHRYPRAHRNGQAAQVKIQ